MAGQQGPMSERAGVSPGGIWHIQAYHEVKRDVAWIYIFAILGTEGEGSMDKETA